MVNSIDSTQIAKTGNVNGANTYSATPADSLFQNEFKMSSDGNLYCTNPIINALLNGEDPFDGEFFTTLMMFKLIQQGKIPSDIQGKIVNKNYNTKTDMATLKGVYNPEKGNTLANVAEKNANGMGTTGWCLKGVRTGLEKAGVSTGASMGASAYQATNALDKNPNFKKVEVAQGDLTNLPAGCVIVWDASAGHEHGHIAVTLGDGKEASDHVQNISQRNASHSVYVPV